MQVGIQVFQRAKQRLIDGNHLFREKQGEKGVVWLTGPWPLPSTLPPSHSSYKARNLGSSTLLCGQRFHQRQKTLAVGTGPFNSVKAWLISKRIFLFWFFNQNYLWPFCMFKYQESRKLYASSLLKVQTYSLQADFLTTVLNLGCICHIFPKGPKRKKYMQLDWIYYLRQDDLDLNLRSVITLPWNKKKGIFFHGLWLF